MRGTERHPGLGHPGAAVGAGGGQRDAEVRDQRLPVVQQDVLGLDVAVDHAVPVGVVEGARHLAGDPHGIGDGQLPLARQPVAERLALHKRHHVEHGAAYLARVVQRQDVRVLEVGRRLDLGEEPLGPDYRGEFGTQDLDRHVALVAQIAGQVDRRHPARAELALDPVAVGQGGGERRHRGVPPPDGWFRITRMECAECSGDESLMRNRCSSGATAYGRPA